MRNRIERLEHKARRAFAAEDWPTVASAYERLVRASPDDERAAVPLLDQWQAEASAQRSWYDLRS
jgi:hypothetical protein